MDTGTLYYGDCLDWMAKWNDNAVDLIYLDPPFKSNASYNILYGQEQGAAQYRAFDDTWYWDAEAVKRYGKIDDAVARPCHNAITGLYKALGPSGMMAYLTYMAERLEHMHRLLKPTGSVFLHCDPTASHYLKIVMDGIFARKESFRNEIIWGYTGPGSPGMRQFNRKHDTIFWYSKGDTWCFNPDAVRLAHHAKTKQNFKEGLRGSGFIADNYDLAEGGKVPETWWVQRKGNGLAITARYKNQYLGYPTQKLLALLKRILLAASNKGDVVLDPFCGCGTTVEAAQLLNRQWAGIDISPIAIDIVKDKRLSGIDVSVKGIPADFASARKLAKESPFDFEGWAVTRIHGFAPNTRRVGDGGVDGRGKLAIKPDEFPSRLALAQVKGGKFNLNYLRDFNHVADRDKGAANCLITLNPVKSNNARAAAAQIGQICVQGQTYDRMNLWSIADYFDDRMPLLPVMVDPYTGKVENQTELAL